MDDLDRIRALRQQGFFCSQILTIMGLELQGKTNPDFVRAMNALAGGIGFTGEICGALTGSACVLGLYAGKGTPEEEENLRLNFMLEDLTHWFTSAYGQAYGGIRCQEILEGDARNMSIRCPNIVLGAWQKVKELLVENGFDLAGGEL